MSKQTVIVSGGALEEEFTLNILNSEDTEFVIGVDRGLGFLYDHKIEPDYIVGDFDSAPAEIVQYYRENTDVPIRTFNPVKDASDTEIAMRLCLGLRREPDGSCLGECADLKDRAGCRRGGSDHGPVE